MFSVALFLPSGRPALQLAGALARRCSDFPLPPVYTDGSGCSSASRLNNRNTRTNSHTTHTASSGKHHDRRIVVCYRDVINQRKHRLA